MNKLKYKAKTNKFWRIYLRWKIKFFAGDGERYNYLIKSFYFCYAIIGIEYDNSTRMLTFLNNSTYGANNGSSENSLFRNLWIGR